MFHGDLAAAALTLPGNELKIHLSSFDRKLTQFASKSGNSARRTAADASASQ
jgi:hypothetical protein